MVFCADPSDELTVDVYEDGTRVRHSGTVSMQKIFQRIRGNSWRKINLDLSPSESGKQASIEFQVCEN